MATEKEAVPRSDLNSQDTKGRECGTPSGRWTCRVWLVPEEMFFTGELNQKKGLIWTPVSSWSLSGPGRLTEAALRR
jgi:hypothetical protein